MFMLDNMKTTITTISVKNQEGERQRERERETETERETDRENALMPASVSLSFHGKTTRLGI